MLLYLTLPDPQAPEQTMEKLQLVLVKAQQLRDKAVQQPEAVAQAIAAAASTLPPIPLSRGLRVVKMISAEAQEHLPSAVDLLASIRELGTAAGCLEHPATPHGPPKPANYLIAANLYECEAIMPVSRVYT